MQKAIGNIITYFITLKLYRGLYALSIILEMVVLYALYQFSINIFNDIEASGLGTFLMILIGILSYLVISASIGKFANGRLLKTIKRYSEVESISQEELQKLYKMFNRASNSVLATPLAIALSRFLIIEDEAEKAGIVVKTAIETTEKYNIKDEITLFALSAAMYVISMRLSHFDNARAYLREITELYEKSDKVREHFGNNIMASYKANMDVQDGNFDEAEKYFKEEIEKNSKEYTYIYMLGKIYFLQGKMDEAIEMFELAKGNVKDKFIIRKLEEFLTDAKNSK